MPISDPTSARILVYNVVVHWVSQQTDAATIDISRTFVDDPPEGYGFDQGEYLNMCDEITSTISKTTARSFVLPGAWRLDHQQDSIGDFINQAAIVLIAAPLSPPGVQAHTWAMT